MADLGLRSKMLVRDVMSSPAMTISEDASTDRVAKLMEKHDVGCIIVTGKSGKPLGIITERDLVVRVVAKNLKPEAVKAKKVMTAPLITIEPDATISQAAKMMNRLNIRRLGVIYKGQVTGVLSSKDVLGVMPELLETIQERARIENENESETAEEKETEKEEEPTPLSGYCDRCGVWSDDLQEVNGELLCEDCRIELEETEE